MTHMSQLYHSVHLPQRLYILQQRPLLLHIYCHSSHKSWTWKQSSCQSADEWVMKMWSLYMVEYY